MLDTVSLRQLLLSSPLQEQPVVIPGWDKAADGTPTNLVIRELNGKSGTELLAACSDSAGTVNQEALVAGIILATLRNGDDANKSLVFASDPANAPDVYDPAFRDSLMATGLGHIMAAAQASIKLSGLDAAAKDTAKNA